MLKFKTRHPRLATVQRAGLKVTILLWAALASLTAQTSLTITSPPNGMIVNPGQGLSVTLTPPAGITLTALAIVGPDAVGGIGCALTAQPWICSIQIPATTPAMGAYSISAHAATSTGQEIDSNYIDLDLERPDSPVSLSLQYSSMSMVVKESTPLRLRGLFSDGKSLGLTESTKTNYVSANSAIATVNSVGMVTAVTIGSTQITVTNGNATTSILVTVVSPIALVPGQTALHPSETQQFIANASDQSYNPVNCPSARTWEVSRRPDFTQLPQP